MAPRSARRWSGEWDSLSSGTRNAERCYVIALRRAQGQLGAPFFTIWTGQALSLIGSLTGLAAPLGLAVAGPVADALGVGAWFIVGGVACILMGVVGLNVPALLNIEQGRAALVESVSAETLASEHETQEA